VGRMVPKRRGRLINLQNRAPAFARMDKLLRSAVIVAGHHEAMPMHRRDGVERIFNRHLHFIAAAINSFDENRPAVGGGDEGVASEGGGWGGMVPVVWAMADVDAATAITIAATRKLRIMAGSPSSLSNSSTTSQPSHGSATALRRTIASVIWRRRRSLYPTKIVQFALRSCNLRYMPLRANKILRSRGTIAGRRASTASKNCSGDWCRCYEAFHERGIF